MTSSVVKHSLTINARGAADLLQLWEKIFAVVRRIFCSGARKFSQWLKNFMGVNGERF
jgi:hypothetical protein